MNILFVTLFWKPAGGLEQVNRDTVSALLDLGHEVTILSVFGIEDEPPPPGAKIESLCPRNRLGKVLWCRRLWKPFLARRLRRCSDAYDRIIFGHVHVLKFLNHVTIPREKMIAWVYGLEVWGRQSTRWSPYLKQMGDIVSISRYTLSHLDLTGYQGTTHIVPCCVDTSIFTPTATPERIRYNEVLICGRMASPERSKGHDVLFRAIPLAEKQLDKPLRVRVAGTGPDLPRLKKLVAELGLEKQVVFTGRLSREELVGAYQHCGVFCMPTPVVNHDPDYWNGEGFGIVYIEAASCGRPVVASREGGAPETIINGKTGRVVDPHSARELADSIFEILGNPARSDHVGKQGREYVLSNFSFKVFKSRIGNLLSPNNLKPN